MSGFGALANLTIFGTGTSIVTNIIGRVIILIILVLVIVLIVRYIRQKKVTVEKLDNVSDLPMPASEIIPKDASHETESKRDDVPVKPQLFDAGSGTVLSGPEFVPSQFLSPWYQAYTGDMKNHYLLDDGAGGSAGLQFNMCSKSCCSEQYPLPFKMPVDSAVCGSKDEFVPNNYTCNNAWQDSGCVCMTKDQANFIGSRGGNA